MTMLPQRRFVKGLNADCSPIMQPPGSVPRLSNFVFSRRGSLVTVDGSRVLSANDSAYNNPIIRDLFLLQQNPGTDALTDSLLALIQTSAGVGDYNLYLVDVSNPTWSGNLGLVLATSASLPTMLQFNNQLIIALGPNIGLQYFDPTGPAQTPIISTLGQLANNFAVSYPLWSPQTSFSADSFIQVPFFYDGTNYYPCLNWIANASVQYSNYIIDSNNNAELCVATGISGYGPPTWPTTIDGVPVNDNTAKWQLVGLQGPWANPPAANTLIFLVYRAKQGGITGSGPQPPAFNFDGVIPPDSGSLDVNDGSIVWTLYGPLTGIAKPPLGAAHAIIYGGSLWVLNTAPITVNDANDPSETPTNGPTCIRMSDTNNPNSWNPANIAFLGKDDGTIGQGLAVFTIAETGIIPTQSLIAFKDYTTYQITGLFGASDFSIQQAQTDMGCLAPRSIQFLPGYGIGRLAHLGVAIFDGVRDRIISDDISPYLFGDPAQPDITPLDWGNVGACHSAQSIDPAMYLLAIPIIGSEGMPTRILCYDLILKAWTIVDLPWPIYGFRQIRPEGSQPYTVVGVTVDGSVRRVFGGDPDWDGFPITWKVRTPEVFSKSYAENIYTRAVYIRGFGPINYPVLGDWATDQVVSAMFPLKVQPLQNNQFELFMQMHSKSKNIHADFTGQGRIIIDSFDWDADQQPEFPSILV